MSRSEINNPAGLIDLSRDGGGILSLEGKDAVAFLQGYTTCDLEQIGTQLFAQLGAICTLKGRMLTSFLAVQHEGRLMLRMDPALVPVARDFLAKYIVFSKAEMQDISADWHCYGILNGSPEKDKSEGASLAQLPVAGTADEINISLPWGQEIWSRNKQEATGNIDDWRAAEVDFGLAWVRVETQDAFLPQMLNYHELGGVDFDKGCYLGQEVVARAQFRGELKRGLRRVDNAGGLKVGDEVDGGKVVAVAPDAALAVLS